MSGRAAWIRLPRISSRRSGSTPMTGSLSLHLGLAFMRRRDPVQAIRNFDRSLEPVKGTDNGRGEATGESSFHATAYYQRGLAYTLPPLENYLRAIEDFERALALTPEDEILYLQRG